MSLNAFLSALQFLSIIPVKNKTAFDSNCLGFFPLVGLLLALLCSPFLWLSPLNIGAFLFVMAWAIITGALHLDGLADTTDAYMASHKASQDAKQRFLKIAHDPNCGPLGVIALVLVLLGKYCAISELGLTNITAIILALSFARVLPLIELYLFNYARDNGMGGELKTTVKEPIIWGISLIPFIIGILILPTGAFAISLIMLTLVVALHRWLINPIIDGCTGDTMGASIELAELFMLTSFAVLLHA